MESWSNRGRAYLTWLDGVAWPGVAHCMFIVRFITAVAQDGRRVCGSEDELNGVDWITAGSATTDARLIPSR